MNKKILSMLLAIIMLMTNIDITVLAAEMKERIRREINKEIVNGNEKLSEEYDYLDQANIQTFDSFALELVRKYHYLLNVSRDISICDDSMLVLKTKEIVDEVFKKHYDDNDEMFNKMMENIAEEVVLYTLKAQVQIRTMSAEDVARMEKEKLLRGE